MLARTLLATIFGATVISAASAVAPVPAADELLDRALDRAINRGQRQLERNLDFYVDHSQWETAWRVKSDHYEIVTTHSRALGAQIAQDLEYMLGQFQWILGTEYLPPNPFQILIFPGITEYNAFGDEHGTEHSSFYGVFYADQHADRPVATLYDPNFTRLRMFVTHGAAHQFVAAAFPSAPPPWVSEGLASYFANYWATEYAATEHRRLSDSDQHIPLGLLLSAPLAQYTQRSTDRLMELGNLFAYLLWVRDDTRQITLNGVTVREPFADYVRVLLRGGDVTGLDVHQLVTRDWQDLDTDFRAHDFQ